MKSTLVAPAATVTLAGTVAILVSPVASSITAPPAGAAALRVTVPAEGLPPTTLAGFRLTEEISDHAIRPVRLQLTPLFVLLYAPLVAVLAYKVVGVRGSGARAGTSPTPGDPVTSQPPPRPGLFDTRL